MKRLSLFVIFAIVGCGAPAAPVDPPTVAGDGGDRPESQFVDGGATADGGTHLMDAGPHQPDGDAGVAVDAGAVLSRCEESAEAMTCSSQTVTVSGRTVRFEVPPGTPPPGGWPAVLYFQGSFFSGSAAFSATPDAVFGQYSLTRTVKSLLNAGYAVAAPNAFGAGTTYWQTNIPPWATFWTQSADHAFMTAFFEAIEGGQLGALDAKRLYAMGISSGGFMTSRMAVSYPGRFRALAIHSGSYATCGSVCFVPSLPQDHPPTLFVHGSLDAVMPVATMELYRDALLADGREVRTALDPRGSHEWLEIAVTEIPNWFNAHP